MAISLQKSTVVKVVGVSLVMLLAACSTDQRYKRQVSGDESYLTAPGLKPLNAPSGMILPVQMVSLMSAPLIRKALWANSWIFVHRYNH